MSSFELDRVTDAWLREHDPYFKCKKKNKRKNYVYSYETDTQTRFREKREFPFSCLSLKQRIKANECNLNLGYLNYETGEVGGV